MRLRKLALSVVLAFILFIQSICLGWSIVQVDRYGVVVYTLHVVFALYTLVLSVRAIGQTGPAHAHSVMHLSALTCLATALLTTTAILPSTPVPVASHLRYDSAVLALWYSVYALYFSALAIAATIPRGPKLHFPAEEIYFNKGAMSVMSQNEDNVSGITSERLLDPVHLYNQRSHGGSLQVARCLTSSSSRT